MSDATRKLEEQMEKVYRYCEQNRISFIFSYQGLKESEVGNTAIAGTKPNRAAAFAGIVEGMLGSGFKVTELVEILAKVYTEKPWEKKDD